MLDTGTATLHIAMIGADYFLIQDSPGYQGMLDTGTAASNLTWDWLHKVRVGLRNKVLGLPPTPTRHPAPRYSRWGAHFLHCVNIAIAVAVCTWLIIS